MSIKKTLGTIALSLAPLFVNQISVRADGFDYAPKEGQTASESKNAKNLVDGYLKVSGDTSPDAQGITASGKFMIKPDSWRIGATALADFRTYKAKDDTNANVQRLEIEGGKYLTASPQVEVYAEARLGGELAQIGGADFDLKVNDLLIGGFAGVASQENGFKVGASFDYATGKFNADVKPNTNIDGDYTRTQGGIEGSLRLWSEGEKQTNQSFDTEPRNNKEKSIVAKVQASYGQENYKGVQKTNMLQAGGSVKYTFDGKDWGFGIGPAVNYEASKTTGDFETVNAKKLSGTIQLEGRIKDTFYFGVEGGWEHYENGSYKDDGLKAGAFVGVKF